MARFAYVARDTGGQSLQGEVAAPSSSEAARLLRADGKFVVTLRELAEQLDPARLPVKAGRRRVSRQEVIHFASQLSIMIESGVPITEAISGMIEQAPPGAFQRTLTDVVDQLEEGNELSTALARHSRVFNSLFVSLIRAAEASGTLGPMLMRCADYLREEHETRRRVRGAMLYPAAVLVLCVGVTIFLMTFLLPKFAAIYEGKEAVLPKPTLILMAVSTWMTNWWKLWVPALLGSLAALWAYLRSQRGRKTKNWLLMHLPLLGRLYQQAILTRSLRTLATLIDSGVSMLDAVAITRDVSRNHFFELMWDRVTERLHRGEQLSTPLFGDPLVPRYITQMVYSGERSGQLGSVLGRVGSFLEEDLRTSVQSVTKMVEPALMVIMGSIVGGIAIALLLPIFTISRVIAR